MTEAESLFSQISNRNQDWDDTVVSNLVIACMIFEVWKALEAIEKAEGRIAKAIDCHD